LFKINVYVIPIFHRTFYKSCHIFSRLIIGRSVSVVAQDTTQQDRYARFEVMIPMRDGVKLHTVVFTPKQQIGKLPFLYSRTPYGINGYQSPEKNTYVKEMAVDGYIFVYQDIRGRNLSEGKFEMQRLSRNKSTMNLSMKAQILMILSSGYYRT
jgi:cephalosporin-C deacetylase-like acetyl esterase